MAIYHFSAKSIGRAAGRSATGAAAYRAAEKIIDLRTGLIHDFTRKSGVVTSALFLPGGGTESRASFWNRVEAHHKRGDAVLAREVEVALPAELSADERARLAFDYALELANRYGVVADVALHRPSRDGDERNDHAHIMLSACMVTSAGELGKKAVELDPIHCQRRKLGNMADRERGRWSTLANERLREAGASARIDHRTLAAQGVAREPTIHLGPTVTEMLRRGKRTEVGWRIQQEIDERLAKAAELGRIAREQRELQQAIVDTTTELRAALEEALHADAQREKQGRLAEQVGRLNLQRQRELGQRRKYDDEPDLWF
jgi:hypothetical protein